MFSNRLCVPFIIPLVPRECVDVRGNDKILAAESGITPEECEKKPDRCYWTDGWDHYHREMKPGTCYYKKGI